MNMNELEQARENYIQAGNKYDPSLNEYSQKFYIDEWIQETDINKYTQAYGRWYCARGILLKLEIKHILATKISI